MDVRKRERNRAYLDSLEYGTGRPPSLFSGFHPTNLAAERRLAGIREEPRSISAQPQYPSTRTPMGVLPEAGGFVPGLGGDFVPKYQDVNPFIWNPRTGEKDRSYFDETINLLTARHPNFAAEYAANPLEALQRYDPGTYHQTGPAHDYYANPDRFGPEMPPGLLGMTPEMIDDPSGMDAATLARTGGLLPGMGILGQV